MDYDGLFVERSVAISVNIHAKSVDCLAIANFIREKRYLIFIWLDRKRIWFPANLILLFSFSRIKP